MNKPKAKVKMHIDDVRPYERNQKKHPPEQIKLIADSMEKLGVDQSIVLNSNNEIIIGHGRYLAMKLLGWTELRFDKTVARKGENFVPVVYRDDLNEAEVKIRRLNDNKLNESDWDMPMVKMELLDLKEMGADINLTGFSEDLIIKTGDEDDEAPDLPASTKTKHGDIYQCGNHRVMCGDATIEADVARLMGGGKAHLIFTDPPYNADYSGRGKNTRNKIQNDNLDEQKFRAFLTASFKNCYRFLKPKGALYSCHSSRTHREFEDALEQANFHVKNQIIWVKVVASMGWGDYRWKHEPILYCGKNKESVAYYGDRSQYTEWREQKSDKQLLEYFKKLIKVEEDGKSTVWRFGREMFYKHPTQKPVELIMRALFNSSLQNDSVLDLFAGSGSTLIAAEKTNRNGFMMELDGRYVDVIVDRWEKFAGAKAIKLKE